MPRIPAPYPPKCPFCHRQIERPRELEPKRLGDFAYGRCTCGAVYVFDVTGHNLGAAFSEALGFGCGFDWDLAWGLMPDEDYEERTVERYDIVTHLVHPGGRTEDQRMVRGVLLFMRFAEDVTGLKKDGGSKGVKIDTHDIDSSKLKPKIDTRKRYTKREVRSLLESKSKDFLDRLETMAAHDPRVLNWLQQALYTPDPTKRMRAILAIGRGARSAFKQRPGLVGEFLRRLLYSASDSAASNWGAIEAAGAIIAEIPGAFDPFIQELLALMRFPDSRVSVLWAIGRIGQKDPNRVKSKVFFRLLQFLEDEDPEVRGHTAWVMGILKANECERALEGLKKDPAQVTLLTEDGIVETTVGELAAQALISQENKEEALMENQRTKEAVKLCQEGEILSNQGRTLDAIEKLQEALAIFEDEGKEREIANTCEKLGDIHCLRGNLGKALPLFQRALTICKKKEDPVSELVIIEKITDIYREQGKMEQNLPYYMRALEISEMAQDAGRAGYYLTAIGDVFQRKGELQKALDAYRTALSIYKQTKSLERAQIIQQGIDELEAMIEG